MTTCSQCGAELEIGSWPYCPHGSLYAQPAQHFDPIVVHQAADGSYSFPASVDAPIRPGYRKVEIRTLREADRITREVNSREDAKIEQVHRERQSQLAANVIKSRAELDQAKSRFTPQGREFAAKMREYVNQKRRPGPGRANFHIDVFANDQSNREAHADARTDWKSRKG
jgi:hypothetical protein